MQNSQLEHRKLILLLHAFTLSPASLVHVKAAVAKSLPGAHVLVPSLPLSLFSTADPTGVALDVVRLIDQQVDWRERQGWPPFEEIVLIGHSFGALIARKAYVLCAGETEEARFSPEHTGTTELLPRRRWADAVTRIVLLAGMNRGWSITHHLNLGTATMLFFGNILGNVVLTVLGKRLAIFQIRRGAPFITELRLQWLALQQEARKRNHRVPVTVQLLGTIDDLVSPDDNIDLVTGREFLYLQNS